MTPSHWSPELGRNPAVGELLRMIRAVIRDGEVTQLEAEFIRFWLDENAAVLHLAPLDRVVPALLRLMDAGETLDSGTRRSLLALLGEVTGGADEAPEPPQEG